MADAPPAIPNHAGRATLLVALGALGFATISIFVTIATGTGVPLMAVLAWRYLLAMPILGVAAAVTGGLRFDRRSLWAMTVAGIGQSLIAIITLSALEYVSAATLAFLFYTFPAWVAIIARVRHSEPLTRARLFALALSLGGIAIMVGTADISLHPVGVTLALVGAVIYAAYIPMLASIQRHISPVATSAWMSTGAAIILGAIAAARGELVFSMHTTAWVATTALAMLSTVGAFLAFLQGLSVLGSVRTAIVSTVEPFFTALLAAWILAQPLTRSTLVGGALIAAAVILLQLNPRNGAPAVPDERSR